jgi:hypothetical protein
MLTEEILASVPFSFYPLSLLGFSFAQGNTAYLKSAIAAKQK